MRRGIGSVPRRRNEAVLNEIRASFDNEGTDPTRFGTDAETEMRVGLNYYYKRHNLKLQADAAQIETQLTPLTLEPGVFSGPQIRKNRELRIQAQFIF